MVQITACRMCLASNVRLHSIANTELQEVYEKLTNIAFQADSKPLTACYLCYSQLRTSQNLMLKALKAEELFSIGVPISPLDRQTYKLTSSLTVTTTENICTVLPLLNAVVKEEPPEDCEAESIVKTELFSEDIEVKLESKLSRSPSETPPKSDAINSNNIMHIPYSRPAVSRTYSRKRQNDKK